MGWVSTSRVDRVYESNGSANLVVLRESMEIESVREYLSGTVPQIGSNVTDLVNKMVF